MAAGLPGGGGLGGLSGLIKVLLGKTTVIPASILSTIQPAASRKQVAVGVADHEATAACAPAPSFDDDDGRARAASACLGRVGWRGFTGWSARSEALTSHDKGHRLLERSRMLMGLL